jgi:hypothetical protein
MRYDVWGLQLRRAVWAAASLERNGRKVPARATQPVLRQGMKRLAGDGRISLSYLDACERIWDSFRNDVHHMNAAVASLDFVQLAKSNLKDLALVEKEIFGVTYRDGAVVPDHPQYWDLLPGGTVPCFLRLSP